MINKSLNPLEDLRTAEITETIDEVREYDYKNPDDGNDDHWILSENRFDSTDEKRNDDEQSTDDEDYPQNDVDRIITYRPI